MTFRAIPIAAALLLACAPAQAQLAVEGVLEDYQFADEASLDDRLEATRIEYGIVGGAVAAARDDRVLYARGLGWADREAGTRATADTVFAMASVTKTLTATAIMMLVEDGAIDLDTPVNRYLGNDAIRATYGREDEITVARVMSHTAGLPFFYQPLYADEATVRPTFADLMRDYGYTVLPPGQSSEYSNLGYEILAELIRRRSGMSYERFMQERIFRPLDMDSAFIATGRERPEGTAQRYTSDGSIVPGVDTSHPGAANAFMSVADMIRFGRFWLGAYRGDSPLLGRALARRMITNDAGEEGKGPGLGLWPETYPDETLYVSHGGGMAGAKTRLAILPERNLVIAVAINEGNATAEAVLGEELIRSFENASNLYFRLPKVPEALIGRWRGEIGGNGPVAPIAFDLSDPADPRATIDGRPILVRSITDDAPFGIRLDTELEGRGLGVPHDLRLKLFPEGSGLIGEVKLQARPAEGRDNPGFGYWIRMQRVD